MPTQAKRRAAGFGAAAVRGPAAPTASIPRGGNKAPSVMAGKVQAGRLAATQELADAREQQSATADILRAIARSPQDAQPVFEAIVAHAVRLCHAQFAFVMQHRGGRLCLAARTACTAEFAAYLEGGIALDHKTTTGRAACDRRPVQVLDFMAEPGVQATPAHHSEGIRTVLAIPLLRDERLLGVFTLWRRQVRAFPARQIALLKIFAEQAVIAVENARSIRELEESNRKLSESLDQQTATADILGAISSALTDPRPVFETIVRNAVALCRSRFANVFRFDGERLHFVASHNTGPDYAGLLQSKYPMRPDRSQVAGRVVLSSSVVTLEDSLADAEYDQRFPLALGWRRMLGMPMLRDGKVLGVIVVGWADPGPVPKAQEALLKTFADQAVIAIENFRLFDQLQARNRDLAEALEQQAATADILGAIARSLRDLQPVFDTIVAAALKLCNATASNVVTFDGRLIHVAAVAPKVDHGAGALRRHFDTYPRPPSRDTANTRAVLTASVVTIADVLEDPDYAAGATAIAAGYRSVLSVPLMRDGRPIGAVTVARREPGLWPTAQIALLQTFADQAVIAIENVRLLEELQARNRDLSEALEQQTATAEILRVISQSPTDTQPVFDGIAASVLRLFCASSANVFTFDGQQLHLAATQLINPDGVQAVRRCFPRPPDRGTAASRAVLERRPVAIGDVLDYPEYALQDGPRWGFRSALAVPLLRDGTPIGAIAIGRSVAGPFTDKQVTLLQTFADQAVIAIENVRLFRELQARTAQLSRSVEELRALGEVGQAVSSTLDLETVLRTIVSRVSQLASVDGGAIFEYEPEAEQFRLQATDGLPDELVEALGAVPMRKGEGLVGQLALTGRPAAVGDIGDESVYQSRVRKILIRHGYRSLMAVPLLRENRVLGGLVVNRRQAGEFPPRVIELLQTFATQSALAIQNARLYREIEGKSRELEIASRHKSTFVANMSHELRTPLNAIIGFTRIVMRRSKEQLDPKQYENLDKILASAQHLLALINAILDLAKVEAGRIELRAGEVPLRALLEQCVRTVEPLLADGVVPVRDYDDALPLMWADEEKLRQILINLLSNAAKFTAQGSIRVGARARAEQIEISVADTGIGIPAEKLEAVFEEFEQVEANPTRAQGTGLGLAIARRLARLMGGDLCAASTLGTGSTFTLTLPLRYGGDRS